MAEDKPELKFKYKGTDRFYGVPARDLTVDEWDAMDVSLQREVLASASYQDVTPKKETGKGDDK